MSRAHFDTLRDIVAVISLSVTVAGCDANVAAQQPRPTQKAEVGAETLQAQTVPLTIDLPGRTSSQLTAEVRPRVSGIVLRQTFSEGGSVKAGDVLYELDPAPFEATVRNAQAAVERAQSAIPSARARSERYESLSASSVVSRQDFDEAHTQLLQAEADVAAASAALETARINLEYTKVRAPIDGRIDASTVTQGALVTQEQTAPLTTIRKLDTVYVDLVRSSGSLLALNKALSTARMKTNGDSVSVELWLEDGTRYSHPGKLQFKNSAVSQSTGMVTLRAIFPNPDGVLMPGMYVRAVLEDGFVENSFLVPQRAVSRNARGEATARFVGPEFKVEERVINVERATGNSWLVTSGVREGDRVIVEGLQNAAVGREVNVTAVAVDERTGEVRAVADGDETRTSKSAFRTPAAARAVAVR